MSRFHAPPVSYPAGRFHSAAVRWLWAVLSWQRPISGWVAWSDGGGGQVPAAWQWADERGEHAVALRSVRVTWSLPKAVLLRCEAASGTHAPRWVWLLQRHAPDRWHALHCALAFHG